MRQPALFDSLIRLQHSTAMRRALRRGGKGNFVVIDNAGSLAILEYGELSRKHLSSNQECAASCTSLTETARERFQD